MDPTATPPTTTPPNEGFKKCHRCKKTLPVDMFQSRTTKLYGRCINCRVSQVAGPPEIIDAAVELQDIGDAVREALGSDIRTHNNAYCFEQAIVMSPELSEKNEGDIAREIVEAVEQLDGYSYYFQHGRDNILSNKITAFAFCSQSTKMQRQKPRDQLQRQNTRMDTFDCEGSVTVVVNKVLGQIVVKVKHGMGHNRLSVKKRTDPSDEVERVMR